MTILMYNYRMGSINAALLMSQIARIEKILEAKKKIKSTYHNLLSDQDITYQRVDCNSVSNEWIVVAKLSDKATRDKIHRNLIENSIESKLIFKPASSVDWIRSQYKLSPMNISSKIFDTSLILPSSTQISEKQIERVCKIIKRSL